MGEMPEKKQLTSQQWLGILAVMCLCALLIGVCVGRTGFTKPGGSDSVQAEGSTSKRPKTTESCIGGSYAFGDYLWCVLDIQDSKALLITQDIIERRPYNTTDDPTWKTCTLRQYLNGEFYENFSEEDRVRIIETENNTPIETDETVTDSITKDKVFLLSYD